MTDHAEAFPEPGRGAGSCEIPEDQPQSGERLYRPFNAAEFVWEGITPRVYKLGGGSSPGMGWRDVVRHTLTGRAGEPVAFQLRYFEIGPGGYSSLEKHAHVHSIVVLRGTGQVVVGREVFTVAPFDIVYVPSGVPHQFINNGDEPFGFLCPVDAERDPPQPLTEAELEDLVSESRVRETIRVETTTGVGVRD